jgi:hypothetical protein
MGQLQEEKSLKIFNHLINHKDDLILCNSYGSVTKKIPDRPIVQTSCELVQKRSRASSNNSLQQRVYICANKSGYFESWQLAHTRTRHRLAG